MKKVFLDNDPWEWNSIMYTVYMYVYTHTQTHTHTRTHTHTTHTSKQVVFDTFNFSLNLLLSLLHVTLYLFLCQSWYTKHSGPVKPVTPRGLTIAEEKKGWFKMWLESSAWRSEAVGSEMTARGEIGHPTAVCRHTVTRALVLYKNHKCPLHGGEVSLVVSHRCS